MRRTNQFERTNRDITNALFQIMKEKPFEKITVQNIIDEARINRSTFYQHFPDKYGILESAQESIVSEMTDLITNKIDNKIVDFDDINVLLYEYIIPKKELILNLFSIKTGQFDLKERMIALYMEQLSIHTNKLNETELRITAIMIVELLENYLKKGDMDKEFAQYMLNTFLHITTYFFRVDQIKNAEQNILDAIVAIRESS